MDKTELTEINSSNNNSLKKDETNNHKIHIVDEQTTDVSRVKELVIAFCE